MNKITGIYLITSPSGRLYVGQSEDIYKRWKRYFTYNIKGQHKILNSLIKYTPEQHTFQILIECESEDLNKFERTFGDLFDVLNKKNLNLQLPGYDDVKLKVSDEVRIKISKSLKGKSNINKSLCQLGQKNHRFGKPGSMLGKKLSEEHIKSISDGKKGVLFSDEHKQNLSNKKIERFKDTSKHPRSRKVINVETSEIFNTITEAALSINVKWHTLANWLKNPYRNKSNLIFLKDE